MDIPTLQLFTNLSLRVDSNHRPRLYKSPALTNCATQGYNWAVDGARTRNPRLGRTVLYQLSYYRMFRFYWKLFCCFLRPKTLICNHQKPCSGSGIRTHVVRLMRPSWNQLQSIPRYSACRRTRTYLLRRPIRQFVDAGGFYRPVPLDRLYLNNLERIWTFCFCSAVVSFCQRLYQLNFSVICYFVGFEPNVSGWHASVLDHYTKNKLLSKVTIC